MSHISDLLFLYLTVFDIIQGHGYHFAVDAVQVSDTPWCNISCQSFQVCNQLLQLLSFSLFLPIEQFFVMHLLC